MKAAIPAEKNNATHIKISLPVLYGVEAIPNDFPLRRGDTWEATVEIATGQIVDWPQKPRFQQCCLDMKVRNAGTYTLLRRASGGFEEVAALRKSHVPHGVVPGRFGDYVELLLDKGRITNWPENPDVSRFFENNTGNAPLK